MNNADKEPTINANRSNSPPYSALARVYDDIMAPQRQRTLSLVEQILERHSPTACSLCDVGCGTGMLLDHFARKGFRVIGVEPSPAMLRIARKRLAVLPRRRTHGPGRKPRLMRAVMTDFHLEHPVDLVTATFEVVNHASSPRELECFLRCARRVLVPEGLLWLDASTPSWFLTLWRASPRTLTAGDTSSVWTPRYDARKRRGVMDVCVRTRRDKRTHTARDRLVMRPFEVATVSRALKRTGFELVEARALTGTVLGPRTGRVGYLARRR